LEKVDGRRIPLKRCEHGVLSCGVLKNEILSRVEPILAGTQPSKLLSASFGKKRGGAKRLVIGRDAPKGVLTLRKNGATANECIAVYSCATAAWQNSRSNRQNQNRCRWVDAIIYLNPGVKTPKVARAGGRQRKHDVGGAFSRGKNTLGCSTALCVGERERANHVGKECTEAPGLNFLSPPL